MKKGMFYTGVSLVLTALLCATLCSCRSEQKRKRGKVVRVVLGKIQKQTFRERIPIRGTVYPVEHATISAKIEGTLDDLKVDEGDMVKKGALLFSIDRVTLENDVKVKKEEVSVARTELSTAEIELKLAKTKEEKARQDYNRAVALNRKRVIATTDYESTVVDWKAARAAVEKCEVAVRYRKAKLVQGEVNLQIAQKNLKDAMVTAPFDCLISEKLQEQGEYVKTGANILKLENISKLEIVAYLSSSYHSRIVPGKTPVVITLDGEDHGKTVISYRAATIDPVTRTFKIKILLPGNTRLCSGLLCNLDIVLREQVGYGLPESAILQIGKKFVVYTATPDSKAKSIEVKKGIVDQERCQILNPEKLMKERILVSGQRFVNDGSRLSIAAK